MRRTPLRKKSNDKNAEVKQKIQDKLREGVMVRDGGCILRKVRFCGGEIGQTVIQADHLITRGNSATYADIRLVVCICRACHGWKHYHKEEYDALVKSILSKEIVELWEKCEKDSWKPKSVRSYDWQLALVSLNQDVEKLKLRYG